MKRFLFLLCAAILFSFSIPAQIRAEAGYDVTELSGTVTIDVGSLNVRSGPSKDYSALGKAREGETYTVTGQASTGWYQIDYQGATGYISDQYAEFAESDASAAQQPGEGDPGEETGEETGQERDWMRVLADKGNIITGVVIAVIILVILICIFFTVKKMLAGDEDDEEYDEEQDYDDEEDDSGDDEFEDDEFEDEYAYEPERVSARAGKKVRRSEAYGNKRYPAPARAMPEQEEEDYRVFIDPRYFEDDEPVVKQEEERTEDELKQAMDKLNELQAEIERIKRAKEREK